MRVVKEFMGCEREFALQLGDVIKIEHACGDGKTPEGVAAIFMALSTGRWGVRHVKAVLENALAGGGLDLVRAQKLVRDAFEYRPYLELSALAADLLIGIMSGIEDQGEATGDAEADGKPIRFSEISQICRVFNMSPNDLLALSYADFVNLVKGFNAGGKAKAEPMTPEEFANLLAKYEPEAV